MVSSPRILAQAPLPEQVDLSSTVFFPPIYDQGYIGSCDWFAVVYYQMTFLYNKALNRPAGAATTFSPQFGYNVLNNGASYPYNIRVDDVYKFTMKHGSATMADFPYDMQYRPWCTDPDIWRNALDYRIEGWKHFTYNNTDSSADYSLPDFGGYMNEIKKLLSNGEVLVIQTNTVTGGSQYKPISDDTSTHEDDDYAGQQVLYSGNNGPDHTMALVGYNDHIWTDLNDDSIVQPEEKGALKIADSYAVSSFPHTNGFLWMAYSAVGSSIWLNRVNRMTIRSNYKPKILCKLTLNSAERDKIRFQFGRSGSSRIGDIPADNPSVFDPYGFGYGTGTNGVSLIAGGSCAFDGGSEPGDGRFVIDLTDIYKENNSEYWYLKINNEGTSPCIVREFEITNMVNGSTIKDKMLPDTLVSEGTYRFLDPLTSPAHDPRGTRKAFSRGIKVFPSPVSSGLVLCNDQGLPGGCVKLFSQNGRLLLTRPLSSKSEMTIHMVGFPPGSYFVSLVDRSGTTRHTVRIIKM
jgi:hypothetical protein